MDLFSSSLQQLYIYHFSTLNSPSLPLVFHSATTITSISVANASASLTVLGPFGASSVFYRLADAPGNGSTPVPIRVRVTTTSPSATWTLSDARSFVTVATTYGA